MPTQNTTRFTSWNLDPLEFRRGCTYNDLQVKVIQNLICQAALEKVSLTYDPLNSMAFVQREAELQGQIGILEFLLTQAESLNPVD